MTPKDELASLTNRLKALEQGDLTHRQGGIDISQQDIEKLKLEIEHLKSTLDQPTER